MEKILKNRYQWAIVCALFLTACGVKLYYVAQQHYYVFFSDDLPGSYNLAETQGIHQVFRRIFACCDYTLGSVRPFFTTVLYFLTFKWFGYQPQVAWIMGILVGSLLVPLYFWAITAMISVEVALASSLILVWMSNYIWQSITLTSILCGVLFIVGALLAAARYYRGRGVGYLYLAGCLISLSVFCRYENAILVPAFVGYEYLFDKERKFFPKLVYGLLCAGSSLFILYCNYHVFGDPFHMIQLQITAASLSHNTMPISLAKAFRIVWELQLKLLNPWLWGAAVAGMIGMVVRYRWRALWLFSGVLSLPLYLIYKIKTGTLDHYEDYFFLWALIALPVGLECVGALFTGLGRRKSYGVMALGVVALCAIHSFHRSSEWDTIRWNYSDKIIRLVDVLKGIPATAVLYIDDDLNRADPDPFYVQQVLFYLERNPWKYLYFSGKTEPMETEYYLLTTADKAGQLPQGRGVKVRDYRECGYDGVVLYRFS
ncbi:MAG: hypothetical protein V1673_04370 [Candidatus Omnitrophota bacterium]